MSLEGNRAWAGSGSSLVVSLTAGQVLGQMRSIPGPHLPLCNTGVKIVSAPRAVGSCSAPWELRTFLFLHTGSSVPQ